MADFSVTRYETYKAANTNKDLWITKEEFKKYEKKNKACSSIDFDAELESQKKFLQDKKGIDSIRFDYNEKLSIFWAMKDVKVENYPNIKEEYNQAVTDARVADYEGRTRTAGISCGGPSKGPGELSTLATLIAASNRSTNTNTTTVVNNPGTTTTVTPTTSTTCATDSTKCSDSTFDISLSANYESSDITLNFPSAVPAGKKLVIEIKEIQHYNTTSGIWVNSPAYNSLKGIVGTVTAGNSSFNLDLKAPSPLPDTTKAYNVTFESKLVDANTSTQTSPAVQSSTEVLTAMSARSNLGYSASVTNAAAGDDKITISYPTDNKNNVTFMVPGSTKTDLQMVIRVIGGVTQLTMVGLTNAKSIKQSSSVPMYAVNHTVTGTFNSVTPGNSINLVAGETIEAIGNTNTSGNYQTSLIKIKSIANYNSIVDWVSGNNYAAGDIVLDPATKIVYQAINATSFVGSFNGDAQFKALPAGAVNYEILHSPVSKPLNGSTTVDYYTGK